MLHSLNHFPLAPHSGNSTPNFFFFIIFSGTYSQKESLRITLAKPWDDLDDTLRSSMAEMKNSLPEYLFPKMNDSILNESPAHEDSEKVNFEGNYAKWRNLTLVAKSIHRFKTPIVERIKSAVSRYYERINIMKGKSEKECEFVVTEPKR